MVTIDTDSLVTNKPNACDQYLSTGKESTLYIDFSNCDIDANMHSKTYAITKEPNNGTTSAVGGIGYYKTYIPNQGFKGKDTIKFTATDGVNTSDEKTIYITVK